MPVFHIKAETVKIGSVEFRSLHSDSVLDVMSVTGNPFNRLPGMDKYLVLVARKKTGVGQVFLPRGFLFAFMEREVA